MVTSSAVVGSSAMTSRGLLAKAMAISTRWHMPPDNLVRIVAQQVGAVRKMHRREQRHRPLAPASRDELTPSRARCSSNLPADGHHRVECRHRFLRDEGDVVAQQAIGVPAEIVRKVVAIEQERFRRRLQSRAAASARWCGRPSICRHRIRRPDRESRPAQASKEVARLPARRDRPVGRHFEIVGLQGRLSQRCRFRKPHVECAPQPVAKQVEAKSPSEDRQDREAANSTATDKHIVARRRSSGPTPAICARRSCRQTTGSPRRRPRCAISRLMSVISSGVSPAEFRG